MVRRVRGMARLRLRYGKWANSVDNWHADEAPRLADFSKRQFPEQITRSAIFCLLLSFSNHNE